MPDIITTREAEHVWIVDGRRCHGIAEARCATMNAMDAGGYETGMADMGPIDDGLESIDIGTTIINPIPDNDD